MAEKSAWNYVVSSAPPFRRWRRKNHEISKSIVIGYFWFIVECNPESKEVFFCVQDVVLWQQAGTVSLCIWTNWIYMF